MERIKNLTSFQKFVLLALVILFGVFTVLYIVTTSKVGFAYQGTILVPRSENGNTTYSGSMYGSQFCFTVYPDHTVTTTYEDETRGPYTVRDDPTAVPKSLKNIQGVEILKGEKILFRGGYRKTGLGLEVFSENGMPYDGSSPSYDMETSEDSWDEIVEKAELDVETVIALATDPEMTHKGNWVAWSFCSVWAICTILAVLFKDELFRWYFSFRVNDADKAEPTEWEIFGRNLSWIAIIIILLVYYIKGLQ